MLRFLLWRMLGLLAALMGVAIVAWLVGGGPGRVLRGGATRPLDSSLSSAARVAGRLLGGIWGWSPAPGAAPGRLLIVMVCALAGSLGLARWRARSQRRYIRLEIDPYRTDQASAEALVTMFEALHKRLLQRWWRRALTGQPAVTLEVHHSGGGGRRSAPHPGSEDPAAAWLAVACPQESQQMVEAALRAAYPNCRVRPAGRAIGAPPAVLRLKKRFSFIKRVKVLDHFAHRREPAVDRLITLMGACGEPAFVQIVMTPAPALFERFARHCYKQHEAHISRARREHVVVRDRSMVDDAELRGGLDVQHRPLFFVDLRVIGPHRRVCERIASELRAQGAENSLVERGTAVRHGMLGLYSRRVQRGEGNPMPSFHKGVFASTELAALWQLPSIGYSTVPFARAALPLAPAPPAILRPSDGQGALRDSLGAVSIHVDMRKQNTAVPGTVEQGKSSYLVATVAEDLRRQRCAVIVLDPKGDAADAAVSLVAPERTCTVLDLSQPTCGFNPLAVDAPADVIADYVVSALKNLFTDADIRASSDRYLRNAIIAVLAHDRRSTLWDAARLLSVGEEGYAYRRTVGARVRTLPEFKEISEFFTAELTAQLADARSTTTAKLDAPVNKLARLLNSPSIKRVLLNDSLRVDLDQVITGEEVLVVKGALGAMGAGNTSVLMQLLVGMLDASLARQQDLRSADDRIAVALKVDEAPLVLNRGFTETMALKRSAGLETVACWQTDAQWLDRDVREQLDALFAHRVYFATASASDARAAVALTMAEFSDTVRPGIEHLSALGHPDVRLHLPKHHAIASWTTAAGRQAPFVAQTIPLHVDRARLALHAARQRERGGHHLTDLRQPHWEHRGHAVGSGESIEEATPRDGGTAVDAAAPAAAPADASSPDTPVPALAGTPAESYRELLSLDRAVSVRWAKPITGVPPLDPDPMDLEVLALVAQMGHLLTSQIHRRYNQTRAATTTQRRLKRLSDAGLLQRFQFHRRDGGGVPMCCRITAEGLALLDSHGRLRSSDIAKDRLRADAPAHSRADSQRVLRQARLDVHVAGWALALQGGLGEACSAIRGREESVISPRPSADGPPVPCPGDLRLPGGRTPHDFLRTNADGERVEVDRFETVRPDAIVEVRCSASEPACAEQSVERSGRPDIPGTAVPADSLTDVLVEFDDRLHGAGATSKLERYDHFLAGWSAHTRRYGRRLDATPLVVFVCRDRPRARDCARAADSVLRACHAYAGEYPFDWEYPGRARIAFASERDMHEGLLHGYGVPRLPPDVRVVAAQGDPGAAEAIAVSRELLRPQARISAGA
ncbi:MAG: hypothetical protein JWL67_205 [Solirubrobacterales bacterium]|nr:hypothetical protein [Solirubrobacterales bacterium]